MFWDAAVLMLRLLFENEIYVMLYRFAYVWLCQVCYTGILAHLHINIHMHHICDAHALLTTAVYIVSHGDTSHA